MNHGAITRAMHSRGVFSIAIIVAVAATVIAYFLIPTEALVSTGFVSGWGTLPTMPKTLALAIAVALNASTVALMLTINKAYNLLRSMTRLHATFFLLALISTPLALYYPCPGSMLCLVILWCIAIMYAVYSTNANDTRKVFLVFCILSGASAWEYAYALYIPMFFLVCFQLRIFSLRCLLAIILGIITPWIIMLGLGIIKVSDLQWPFKSFTMPSLDIPSTVILGTTVVFTVVLAVSSLLQNMLKILTYNVQSRSMLSVFSLLTILTAIYALIDMAHVYTYISLLDMCAAFQLAHMFLAIHNFPRSYTGVLFISAIYIALYIWQLFVLI